MKNRGFALVGMLVFVMISIVIAQVMVSSQISAINLHKKKFKLIDQKVDEFNLRVKSERE